MKLVFATQNTNKLKEIQQLLPASIKLISLADIGCSNEIPETASTLEGNAKIKADYVTNTYNLPCFADDTGLLVHALNNEPGVYSARYAGLGNNAQANMNKLLNNLKDKANRAAHFETIIALNMNGKTLIFDGTVAGTITTEQKGEGGFGYDPIFMPEGYDQTFAELPLSVKNKISHRAMAFNKLITYLTNNHVTG